MDSIISVLIGGIITWFCSYLYYRKAALSLTSETQKLKQTLDHVAILITNPDGTYSLRYENGEIVALVGNIKGGANARLDVNKAELRDAGIKDD